MPTVVVMETFFNSGLPTRDYIILCVVYMRLINLLPGNIFPDGVKKVRRFSRLKLYKTDPAGRGEIFLLENVITFYR